MLTSNASSKNVSNKNYLRRIFLKADLHIKGKCGSDFNFNLGKGKIDSELK